MSKAGLENAKRVVEGYKKGEVREMTPEIWWAKKVVDATLHPGMFFPLTCSSLCGGGAGEWD